MDEGIETAGYNGTNEKVDSICSKKNNQQWYSGLEKIGAEWTNWTKIANWKDKKLIKPEKLQWLFQHCTVLNLIPCPAKHDSAHYSAAHCSVVCAQCLLSVALKQTLPITV